MANKRYVCAQACQLCGKRYEVGEYLADGVEPNSHFKDTKTGEMVKAKQPEPIATPIVENQEVVETKAQLEDFKKLVGEHLAKFDKRISALEKACAESKKSDISAKSKNGNKGKEPEAKEKEQENNGESDGNEDIVSDGNGPSDNSPTPSSGS